MKLFLIIAISTLSAHMSAAQIELVQTYHPMERSKTLLSKDGKVFVGRTGTVSEKAGHVQTFNAKTLKLEDTVALDHTIRSLKFINSCQILAAGVEKFSVLDACIQDGLDLPRTYDLPEDLLGASVAVVGNKEFLFSDPSEGLYSVSPFNEVKRFGFRVSYITDMLHHDGKTWIGTYQGLKQVDLETGKKVSLLTTYGEKRLAVVSDNRRKKFLAVADEEEKSLQLIDLQNPTRSKRVKLFGEPAGVVALGHCAVTVLADEKKISFIDIKDGMGRLMEDWDITEAGDALKLPTEITVSKSTQTVFVRSSYPCPSCTSSQSSLYAVKNDQSNIFEMCFL